MHMCVTDVDEHIWTGVFQCNRLEDDQSVTNTRRCMHRLWHTVLITLYCVLLNIQLVNALRPTVD